jgi:hypothetical protein
VEYSHFSLRFAHGETARVPEVKIDLDGRLARFPRPARKSLLVGRRTAGREDSGGSAIVGKFRSAGNTVASRNN